MTLRDLEKRIEAFRKRQSRRTVPRRRKKTSDAPPNWLKKTLLVGTGVGFGIIALGALFIFIYMSAPRGVSVDVYTERSVTRGMPFDVSVSVVNNASMALQDGSITLNLPEGLVAVGRGADYSIMNDTIGELKSGGLNKKTYTLVPIAEQGSEMKITAVFSYETKPGSRFEAEGDTMVAVNDSAIALSVKNPDQALGGSTFSFDVTYLNRSDSGLKDVSLEAEYPEGFRFDSSSIPPSSFTNYWNLGNLPAHVSGTLTISGRFGNGSQQDFSIPLKISAKFGEEDYLLGTISADFTLAPSPLGLEVAINGQENYVARVGDTLEYAVRYRNNSGIALTNLSIRAALAGELFDFSSLSASDASYSATTHTLIWNSGNVPSLRLVDPGMSGEIRFSISLKDRFKLNRMNDKNYSARATISAESPSVPYYLSASRTYAERIIDTKISGTVSVVARAYYRDALSQIANAGSLPPRVGQGTQYTVHWLLSGSANDANNIEARAALPRGVRWTGVVRTNGDSEPRFDSGSNEVVWNIAKLSANRGVLTSPLEAVFQIEAVPEQGQVGSYQTLLGKTRLSATDSFTGVILQATADPLTTALPFDDTVTSAQGIVVQ